MNRRAFISLLGGAAAAWPLAAQAQQPDRMRRIGVLMNVAADDPEGQARIVAFVQGLQQLGWSDGRNVQIDIRWGGGDPERIHKYAAELVALAPDAILATSTIVVRPLQQATHTVPIVFVQVIDPVGAGIVATLARPGGNTTGFTVFEYGLSGKWLELLKEIAPRVERVAVTRDSAGAGPARIAPVRCAQCRRDRAYHRGVRGEFKRWPDRNRNCRGNGSSRTDRCAGGRAPITRRLL
jgi:ABC-type uncharacterized transport system substrate-binding protein